jgi:hypothetical protein
MRNIAVEAPFVLDYSEEPDYEETVLVSANFRTIA